MVELDASENVLVPTTLEHRSVAVSSARVGADSCHGGLYPSEPRGFSAPVVFNRRGGSRRDTFERAHHCYSDDDSFVNDGHYDCGSDGNDGSYGHYDSFVNDGHYDCGSV